MAKVVLLSSDLMFGSRVAGTAKQLEIDAALVPNAASLPDKLTADCRLVLVDLSLDGMNIPSIIKAVSARAPQARIIAYGAHVDRSALADATEAGCHLVLTRNQFNQQYGELLKAAAAA